jgi:hypothetical protein
VELDHHDAPAPDPVADPATMSLQPWSSIAFSMHLVIAIFGAGVLGFLAVGLATTSTGLFYVPFALASLPTLLYVVALARARRAREVHWIQFVLVAICVAWLAAEWFGLWYLVGGLSPSAVDTFVTDFNAVD